MRLVDLEPQWASTGGEGITDSTTGQPVPLREKVGLICNCPKCGADHPMFVPFANPFDGKPSAYKVNWTRTGKVDEAGKEYGQITETFEDMSLKPSILRKDCGWHGFIVNGEVRNA